MILLKLERVYFQFDKDVEDIIIENLFCPTEILDDPIKLKKAVICISENFLYSNWEEGEEEREEVYEKRSLILKEQVEERRKEGQSWENFYRKQRSNVSLKNLLKSLQFDMFGKQGEIWLCFTPIPKTNLHANHKMHWQYIAKVN